MVLPTATSYLSVEDADAYFAASFNNAAWSALSYEEKEIALQEATRWLETLCYEGEKCDAGQPLKWPRHNVECCGVVASCAEIPGALIQATAELALVLHNNPNSIIKGPTTGTGPVKRQKLDALEIEYFDPRIAGTVTNTVAPGDPMVVQLYPWLRDLLSCWANFGSLTGSGLVYRVRS
jgi:hypothetical protein